jgi:hypothetical protein
MKLPGAVWMRGISYVRTIIILSYLILSYLILLLSGICG